MKEDDDVLPDLVWSGVPDDAAELVLLCEDPDAPTGTFVHWLVTGIDPGSGGVEAGRTSPGGQGRNGYGGTGWAAPNPPAGDEAHKYFFRVYALPGPVSLPDNPTADDAAVDKRQLASGTFMGLYHR